MSQKLVRDLFPGDVVLGILSDSRTVLLYSRRRDDTHMMEMTLCKLGEFGESPFIVDWHPEVTVNVEATAGLTPVQQAADKLLVYAKLALDLDEDREVNLDSNYRADLRALLDELEPPKPPTLEEAIALLREARAVGPIGVAIAKFLKRVPN